MPVTNLYHFLISILIFLMPFWLVYLHIFISFSYRNVIFNLCSLFQEHNWGMKQALGLHGY